MLLHSLHLISYVTLCLSHGPFPPVLHTRQSSLSHCRGLHGSVFWNNLLIAIPAFSTALIFGVGETSRGAYTRGKEHEKSLSNKEERSALRKHCKEKHNNEVQRFQMNVTGLYSNDAMLRQISEGLRIDKVPGDSLINSKNEWNFFQIPRAVIPHGRALLSK